jgi:hypothetical protein
LTYLKVQKKRCANTTSSDKPLSPPDITMGSEKDIDHPTTNQTSGGEAPIFKLANECDELFRRAIENAEDIPSSNTTSVAGRIERSGPLGIGSATSIRRLMLDLHTRYGFWASYLGVFAPQSASLDRRLGRNKYYRDMVLLALDMLRDNIVQSALPSTGRQQGFANQTRQYFHLKRSMQRV